MKAYLINPTTCTVSEIEYSGDFHEIYSWIGAQYFDCVRFSASNEDVVYIDDEGLISGKDQHFFTIGDDPRPLAGKGLVLGTDPEGDTTEPETPKDKLNVKFLTPVDVMMYALTEGKA